MHIHGHNSNVSLTSHGDGGGGGAQCATGDEGGGELVGVLQSQEGCGCS